jgi:hypothetical protein
VIGCSSSRLRPHSPCVTLGVGTAAPCAGFTKDAQDNQSSREHCQPARRKPTSLGWKIQKSTERLPEIVTELNAPEPINASR